jgi:hypothetical protein
LDGKRNIPLQYVQKLVNLTGIFEAEIENSLRTVLKNQESNLG